MNRYEVVRVVTYSATVYATDRLAAIQALSEVMDQFEGQATLIDQEAAEMPVERLGGVATITVQLTPPRLEDITREERV